MSTDRCGSVWFYWTSVYRSFWFLPSVSLNLLTIYIFCCVSFPPAQSRWSSAQTCSTFSQILVVFPAAVCGSPPPLWTTAPWKPCLYESSPPESCRGEVEEVWTSRRRMMRCLYLRRIQNDGWQFCCFCWTVFKSGLSCCIKKFINCSEKYIPSNRNIEIKSLKLT